MRVSLCIGSRKAVRCCLYTSSGTALDIKALWDELYDVRSKWKMIGLGLRLQPLKFDSLAFCLRLHENLPLQKIPAIRYYGLSVGKMASYKCTQASPQLPKRTDAQEIFDTHKRGRSQLRDS